MPLSSYDTIPDFGLLYDSVPLYATRQDVPFYVQEAKAVRGTVLELGCGTGTVAPCGAHFVSRACAGWIR